MDDATAGGHPLHLAGLDHTALIPVIDRALEEERHRFEPCVWVGPTDRPIADVQMVIH